MRHYLVNSGKEHVPGQTGEKKTQTLNDARLCSGPALCQWSMILVGASAFGLAVQNSKEILFIAFLLLPFCELENHASFECMTV